MNRTVGFTPASAIHCRSILMHGPICRVRALRFASSNTSMVNRGPSRVRRAAEAMWWCGRRSAWMEVWKSSADVRALLLFAWKMALFVPWGSDRNFSGRILWYWTEAEFITIPHVPVILKSSCRACRREGHDDLCARARVLREYIVDKGLTK